MPIRPENRGRYPGNWSDISWRIKADRAKFRCECMGECGRGTHYGRCPNVHGEKAYDTGSGGCADRCAPRPLAGELR